MSDAEQVSHAQGAPSMQHQIEFEQHRLRERLTQVRAQRAMLADQIDEIRRLEDLLASALAEVERLSVQAKGGDGNGD